jgi:tetratricopeptide (TPR) repeat protein
MKKLLSLLVIVGSTVYSNAQSLPKNSPESEVEQTVGATTIKIEYSRPGVKERTIYGGLVPFDKIWRFGANSATNITSEHSLFFNDKELKAGTYSVFAIPGKESWEIIFNTDTKATVNSYDNEKTVLKVKGKVSENSYTESLYIGFDNLRDESASIIALWEKTKVEIPFTVNTKENSENNIKNAIEKGEDLGSVYNSAASYYYSGAKDYKQALEYIEESIKLESNFRNHFMKARIIYELGDKKKAKELANKSLEMSKDGNASVGYQNYISETIEKWGK